MAKFILAQKDLSPKDISNTVTAFTDGGVQLVAFYSYEKMKGVTAILVPMAMPVLCDDY